MNYAPDTDSRKTYPRLLLVDDDPGILAAVSRFLRRYGFDVTSAPNGFEGLRQIKENGAFHVIISDYRMPGMSGDQFLAQAADLAPESRRMVLSGYADTEQLLSAINTGKVHRYMTKPWESQELLSVIRELQDDYRQLQERRLREESLFSVNKNLEISLLQQSERLEAQSRSLQESNYRLRLLAAHSVQTREEERKSIARDVHDDLGQVLTAMNLQLAAMLQAPPDAELRPRVRHLRQQVEQAIGTVQRIISEMRPPLLDELGLEAALGELAQKVREQGGISCILSCGLGGESVPQSVATTLYRVTQEALTNVLRHAASTKVLITLRRYGGWCQLQVRDNGIGIRPEQAEAADSYGLQGMRERIALCSGSFSISPRAGGGTLVEAQIPDQPEELLQ